MSEITPITREEKLWNGEDLEPLTREEMYIKRIFDKTQIIPDKPLTRKEILMEKAGEGGGGDVTIKQLSVTANGTYSEEGTAYSPVVVNVPTPENAYLLKTASGSLVSFSDGADLPMPSFICNIDAQQDLHGYDAPWVGGAGKNKLPLTLAKLQNDNTDGIWTNNVYVNKDVTWTINSDDDGNIVSISANGQANGNSNLRVKSISSTLTAGVSVTYNGCPANGSASSHQAYIRGGGYDRGSGNSITPTQENIDNDYYWYEMVVISGYNAQNLIFYPMVRLATETDATFAPYENICPISGHTGLDAWVRGKNLCPEDTSNFTPQYTWNSLLGENANTYTNGTKVHLQAGNYHISITDDTNVSSFQLFHSNGDVITKTNDNFTIENEEDIYIRFKGNVNAVSFNTQIELGSTATTYEPYNPNSQTIQVSWQTEVGEVYDGEVDLVSGVLTVTHKSQTGFTRGSQDSSNKLYSIGTISDIKAYTNTSALSPYFVDSMFEKLSLLGARATENPSIAHYNRALYVGGYIGKEAELDTLLETLQVKYELETPIVIQLDGNQIKSLLGNNNAWCSTGDVDIDYFAKEV